MIIVRAPLRISFVGGGTDLPDFYNRYPGRVISTTIDKFVYLAINPKYLEDKFIIKYQSVEIVGHPSELSHSRLRHALLDLGITKNGLEISSFSDIPAKTGLGSSSSFSVALLKGLNTYLGKTISKEDAAKAACRLEIDLLKEPIGKQDQYAAAFGGFNVIEFSTDGSVTVDPVLLDYKKLKCLEDHLILFFTGITRDASSVLSEQSSKIEENFETYQKMSDSVFEFRDKLISGNIQGIANMLHQGWLSKKSLASNVSNSLIDDMYQVGLNAGAWGGKILGAGGGGCLLLLAEPKQHNKIKEAMSELATSKSLVDFKEIPIKFTKSGTDVLFNAMHNN